MATNSISPNELARNHISKKLPVCPLCGSHSPHWKMHYKVRLTGRVQFTCEDCSSVFSMIQSDFMGAYHLRETKNLLVYIYTYPIIIADSIMRIFQRKKNCAYVRIDKYGYVGVFPFPEGKDVPFSDLQKLADNF